MPEIPTTSPFAAAMAALRDELLRQIDIKIRLFEVFKVVDVSPLTVYLAGDTNEPVEALAADGSTFSIGDQGVALVTGLTKPICIKTVEI